jgi:mono/diheme cytochrome c family protein
VHVERQLDVPLHDLGDRGDGLIVSTKKPRVALRLLPILTAMVALGGAPAAGANDGKALFAQHCAACHQGDGGGTPGLAPPIKGEHWKSLGAERSYLPTVILHGLSGSLKVAGQPFVGAMQGFAAQLDDAAIAAIATHVRGLQGASDSYAADDIKALRALAGSGPGQSRQLRKKVLD